MPISRIQLAAALLEYDNDPNDNSRPKQSHRDSAIFAPIKAAEANERRRKIFSQPPPSLPSPVDSTHSQAWRRSTAGALTLQSPQKTAQAREEETEDLADVDVARWSLPEHLVSETPRPISTRRVTVSQPVPETVIPTRVRSIHVSDVLEDAAASWERRPSMDAYGAERALAEAERVRRLAEGRPQSVMGLQGDGDPIMVPLPLSPSPRTSTRPLSSLSRALSPQLYADEEETLDEPNPFALPPPPTELGSKFDPKSLQAQRRSSVSSAPELRPASRPNLSEELHPVALVEDELPTAKPLRIFDEIPTAEQYGRPLMPNRYSTSAIKTKRQSLLRPKILIMPAPLTGSERIQPERSLPEGFTMGERPLPAEARTSGRRPGIPLSLSQKTFRSSLLVDGQRDEYFLGGAEEEGEVGVSRRDLPEEAVERKPGKLYGRSLMDELEARKSAMKGKQRQFHGDSRPAMMARSSDRFLSYDDPTELLPNPPSPSTLTGPVPRPATYHPGARPLLHVSSNGEIHSTLDQPQLNDRLTKSKSVFGVDTLWEKEMAKLKLMQEEEDRLKRENEEKAAAAEARKKRKGKGKAKEADLTSKPAASSDAPISSPAARTIELPPTLEYSPGKISVSLELSGKELDRSTAGIGVGEWFESSDEESDVRKQDDGIQSDGGSSDDEPLSKLATSISISSTLRGVSRDNDSESDEEEDVPLSRLAASARPPTLAGSQSFNSLKDVEEDEDDVPLAVRRAQAKGLPPPTRAEIIEDDLPLGYKHAEAAQRQMADRASMWSMDYPPSMVDPHPHPHSHPRPHPHPHPHPQPQFQTWDVPKYYQGQFGYPVMPYHPNMPPPMPYQYPQDMMIPPSPGHHIDSWRKEVPLASVGSGSGSRSSRS